MQKTLDQSTIDKTLIIKKELIKMLFDEYGVDLGSTPVIDDVSVNYKNYDKTSNVDWNHGFTNGLLQSHGVTLSKDRAKSLDLPYIPAPPLSIPAAAKPGTFNVNAAVSMASQISTTRSSGKCAKIVRTFIEAGGISTAGRPIAAKDYVSFLPKIGFGYVTSLGDRETQLDWTKSQARRGDVAVMDHGQYGHICMYTGSRWVSDFVQNNMWVYPGNGLVHIFRHNNIV